MGFKILSNLIITDFEFSTTMYTEAGKTTIRKNRPCWAAVIKYEGETVYSVKGKKYVSNGNNIIILPKGCSYSWKCTKAGHFSIVEFQSELEYDDILSFFIKNGEELIKTFKALEQKSMYKIECIKEIYLILIRLLKNSEQSYTPSNKQQKIAPALKFISENYFKAIDNNLLAGLCGLSTVYFRKLFTQTVGVSPIAYIHQLKIKKAKEMLKSDYRNITDIALSLGYNNIYDFSRDFKKHTGVSPSKY